MPPARCRSLLYRVLTARSFSIFGILPATAPARFFVLASGCAAGEGVLSLFCQCGISVPVESLPLLTWRAFPYPRSINPVSSMGRTQQMHMAPTLTATPVRSVKGCANKADSRRDIDVLWQKADGQALQTRMGDELLSVCPASMAR